MINMVYDSMALSKGKLRFYAGCTDMLVRNVLAFSSCQSMCTDQLDEKTLEQTSSSDWEVKTLFNAKYRLIVYMDGDI